MTIVEWLDQGAETVVVALHRPWLDAVMTTLTHLGDWAVLAILACLTAAIVFLGSHRHKRMRLTAAIIVAALMLAFLTAEGTKALVERPRPDVPWRLIDLPTSTSFPSGHALESMAFYGALALTLGRRQKTRWIRITGVVLSLSLPLLIGFSRVYLGVHWFTDVLAGWALGLVVALLTAWVDRHWGGARNGASTARNTGVD